ncbi:unnamed protein product [Cylindrotheca closterium]|uniref:Uncharacterized protein n=1 Tax=Cylindrotheca closterium TaxID=2856 RepID=A0AAD2CHC1_9STRA|nr:unnamed protein product [Cylindrotheca closterium]
MNPFNNLFALAFLLLNIGQGNAWTPQQQRQQQRQQQQQQETKNIVAGRRTFLKSAALASGAILVANNGQPLAANAEYGIDAKMSFPDVIQGLNDRANKQCLVESLGNRECLVYMEDAEKFLFRHWLVETKKWNAINGILTGPMGQLSATLTMITSLASDPKVAKDKAQTVKQDLFAMGTANTNKQGDVVLKYQKKAMDDLAAFLQSL